MSECSKRPNIAPEDPLSSDSSKCEASKTLFSFLLLCLEGCCMDRGWKIDGSRKGRVVASGTRGGGWEGASESPERLAHPSDAQNTLRAAIYSLRSAPPLYPRRHSYSHTTHTLQPSAASVQISVLGPSVLAEGASFRSKWSACRMNRKSRRRSATRPRTAAW